MNASAADENVYWKGNLAVCFFGSVTTIVAMTLLLPFLPLYVEQLGVTGSAAIVWWSGVAYGATFLSAALVAPLWGRLADRYGRKLMLVRAALGMAVAMSLLGMAHTVWQLVALRLLAGLLGGYASGSTVLIATQTPKARTGWALGVLSSGIMAGNVIGPLIGGTVPALIGIRATFLAAGALIFVAFLATVMLVKEAPRKRSEAVESGIREWWAVADRLPVVTMLATGPLLLFATTSIEPIITVYVAQFTHPDSVAFVAGLAMSAAALGNVISAPLAGRLGDRIGYANVLAGSLAVCAVLLIPQAYVTASWQLVALRFAMGAALGGLLPCIASILRHSVPARAAGTILGYSVSAQYLGSVTGPLAGGFIAGHFGMRAIFLGTCALMGCGAIANACVAAWMVKRLPVRVAR